MIYFRFHMCCTCHMLVSIVKFRTAHVAGRRSLQSLSQLGDPSKTWIADRRLRPSRDSLHPERSGRCLMERNVSKAMVQLIQMIEVSDWFQTRFPGQKVRFCHQLDHATSGVGQLSSVRINAGETVISSFCHFNGETLGNLFETARS